MNNDLTCEKLKTERKSKKQDKIVPKVIKAIQKENKQHSKRVMYF